MLCTAAVLMSVMGQETFLLRAPAKAGSPERVVERGTNGVVDRAIMDVADASVTAYLPSPTLATGVGIVIAPGGGYARLAIDKEGHDVARWLNTLGVAGFVLKYRLPGGEQMRPSLGTFDEARTAAKRAIEDAMSAVPKVRAKYPGIRRLGMMGFSAGGHLAAMTGMLGMPESRPDFLALIYPALPAELRVDERTPPTFLVHASDDSLSAGEHSARIYQELRKAKVPAELHIYTDGGHGFGIRKNGKASDAWPEAFAKWLKTLSK